MFVLTPFIVVLKDIRHTQHDGFHYLKQEVFYHKCIKVKCYPVKHIHVIEQHTHSLKNTKYY